MILGMILGMNIGVAGLDFRSAQGNRLCAGIVQWQDSDCGIGYLPPRLWFALLAR
jgi:hypothetical protein